jgi:hypothetical protein
MVGEELFFMNVLFKRKEEVIDLFLNERKTPVRILQLQAAKRRLLKSNPKRALIEQDLQRRLAGLWGEKEVDKRLKRLDQEKYSIICDLRLPNGDGTYFQIDTLVLSTCFILIIEAKNIAGSLYFDLTTHQFYRIKDTGEKESFSDPVSQGRLHVQQLRQWLLRNKFSTIFIDFLITMANPHSIFYISPQGHPYAQKIAALAGLTWEIDNLEERCQKEYLTVKEIRRLGKALLKAHTPLQPSEFLQYYDILFSELQPGVHCPRCEYLPLTYRNGKWDCPNCKEEYKDAYKGAANDYLLLIDSKLTNAEFRRFIQFKNADITTKMLGNMNLLICGKNRGRYYQRI